MKRWRIPALCSVLCTLAVLSATSVFASGAASATSVTPRPAVTPFNTDAAEGRPLPGPTHPTHQRSVFGTVASANSGTGFLTIFQELGKPATFSVGGGPRVTLGYGEYTYGLVASGTYTVTAYRRGATIAMGDVTVGVGRYETALLYPDVNGKATITGFSNDRSPVPVGTSRIVIRNTAKVGPVDIYLNGTRVVKGLANRPSSPASVSLVRPAGKLKIEVVPTGQPERDYVYSQTGVVVAGDLLNVFVIGFLSTTKDGIHLLTNANPLGIGYRLYSSDGGVFDFGNAGFYGSMGGRHLNQPVVGASPTSLGFGYWLVARDGGVFSFGGAAFQGSAGSLTLNKPVVGMSATPNSKGYWLVASDGGVFSYGDAGFYGSTGDIALNKPIVGLAPDPDGGGYWLVASDGGVFAFGNAKYFGSMGGTPLNSPVVAIVPTVDGHGYWLVAADGGVFSFGDAPFFGSMGGTALNKPIVAGISAPDSLGYWLVASDGGVFSFGQAQFYGSTGALKLDAPIVGGTAPGAPLPNS